ncbi:MAG: hypothetical protein GY749_12125 [Desulfobacteraceae bacterium]|nr:hypothetical protein [Desulfobacteraceae bacterium]
MTKNRKKRKRTFEAMKKLRGSGNSRLVDVLLQERERGSDMKKYVLDYKYPGINFQV